MTWSLSFAPLLPWAWLAAAATLGLVLLAAVALRRRRGWPLRALALALLLAALANPRAIEEERQARPDVTLIVVDESPSMGLAGRDGLVASAHDGLQAALATIEGVETRVVKAGADDGTGETRLFAGVQRALADDVGDRLGAVFVLTDGAVHDVPTPEAAPWLKAPVHVLLAGAPGEVDRRVVALEAPAYGLVGGKVDIAVRVEDLGAPAEGGAPVPVEVLIDGKPATTLPLAPGETGRLGLTLEHAGPTVVELAAAPRAGEVSTLNNRAAVVVQGVRDRLKVLLVSGQPHPGERTWRNLLKSDPGVDLVHFTILRPPEKEDATPLRELSLIVFPVDELFERRLYDFDLIIFDRYMARNIMPLDHIQRVADYVRRGGAILLAVGPEYAGPRSLVHTPLAEVLPAAPTGAVIEKAFRPTLTEVGHRHPVTAQLRPPVATTGGATGREGAPANATDAGEPPSWGRWYRLVDSDGAHGEVLMRGADGRPLLVVDRVGEGRVGQLLSDHIWLWARGHDGGGPQTELLRRLAHWLMKEPTLEEERLSAQIADGRLRVQRHSLTAGNATATVTLPSGATTELPLIDGGDGVARGELPAGEAGLYRVREGGHDALAASGRVSPPEFADLRATPEPLAPVVQATGGGVVWLKEGLPQVRAISRGRAAEGRGWLGVRRNRAFAVTGFREVPLLPGLLVLAAGLTLLAGAWWREGR